MRPIRFISVIGALLLAAVAVSAQAPSKSPVADAAMRGDLAAVRTLIGQKADVNVPQAMARRRCMGGVPRQPRDGNGA